jgi:hypothetical protein
MYYLIMSKKYYFIILFYNIILNIKFKIIFYFKNLLPTFSFYPPPHGLHLHIIVSISINRNQIQDLLIPKDQP